LLERLYQTIIKSKRLIKLIKNLTHHGRYGSFLDLEADVTLSQLNVWSSEQPVTSDMRCFIGVKGDVIGWKDFEDADIDGAFIQTPSVCDGTCLMCN